MKNQTRAPKLKKLTLAMGFLVPGWCLAGEIITTTQYTYAATGFLLSTMENAGDAESCILRTQSPTEFGSVKTTLVSNCAGAPSSALFQSRLVQTGYSNDGRLVTDVINPLGHRGYFTVDQRTGLPTRVQHPNGSTLEYQLDSLGRVVLEKYADGSGMRSIYKPLPDSLALMDHMPTGCKDAIETYPVEGPVNVSAGTSGPKSGGSTTTFFDDGGRVCRVMTVGFDGRTIYEDVEYGANMQISGRSLPYYRGEAVSWKRFAYDKMGRLTSTIYPDMTSERVEYTGLATTKYDRSGNAVIEVANFAGLVESRTESGLQMTFAYDAAGRVTAVTDAGGAATRYAYTLSGGIKQTIDPNSGVLNITRNALGEVKTSTDQAGNVRSTYYDILGRVVSRVEPSGTYNWTYDSCPSGIGQLCSESASGGFMASYWYDAAGRMNRMQSNIGGMYTSSRTFDAAGRVDTLTYPTGLAVKYVYNANGYLSSLVNRDSPGWAYWTAYQMDSMGRTTLQTVGEGIAGWSNAVRTQSTYQTSASRLTSRQVWRQGGSTYDVMNAAYNWNPNGTMQGQQQAAGVAMSSTYNSDGLKRLSSEVRNGVAMTYPVQPNGNLTSMPGLGNLNYPYSGGVLPHAVSSITGTVNGVLNPALTYDTIGRMNSGMGYTFNWTSFGKPNRITRLDGSQLKAVDFVYNGSTDRVQESYSVNSVNQRTSRYINAGFGGVNHYEEDISSAGTNRKHYLNVNGVTVGVVLQRPNMTWGEEYWHSDAAGTVKVVTDGQTGSVKERLYYDSFGKRRTSADAYDPTSNITASTDRGFTGHEMMDEMGLVNMGGRIYMPQIGRFASPDPVVDASGSTQGLNAYSYGINNPWTGVDPSGNSWRSFTRFLERHFKESFDPREVKRMTSAAHKLMMKPYSLRRVYEMAGAVPGQQTVDQEAMTRPWFYNLGKAVTGAVTYVWCLGCGAAFYEGYYTYLRTNGDEKASAKAAGTVMAFNGMVYGLERLGDAYSNASQLDAPVDQAGKAGIKMLEGPTVVQANYQAWGLPQNYVEAANTMWKIGRNFVVFDVGASMALSVAQGGSLSQSWRSMWGTTEYGGTVPDVTKSRWYSWVLGGAGAYFGARSLNNWTGDIRLQQFNTAAGNP